MAPSREVKVAIIGDPSSLRNATNQAANDLDRLAASAKSFGDKAVSLGKNLAMYVSLPIAAIAAVGFRELTVSGKVAAQTEAAIRSTGGAANVTAAQIDRLATSLMRKSGIDDEAIKSGENLLLTFTNIRNEAGRGNDIFNQATEAALDLSIAFGKDMTDSAILVGKALQDPIAGVTALRRVGVQLSDAQREQIKNFVEAGDLMSAQKVILRELTTEVGGSAAAYGKTLAGQVSRAREELTNAAGAMLVVAAPAVTVLARAVLGLSSWMQSLNGTTKTVVVGVAAFAAVLGPALIIVGKMAQGFAVLASAGPALASGLETIALKALYVADALRAMSLAQIATMGGLGLVLGGVAALILALSLGKSRYEEVTAAAKGWADTQVANAAALGTNSAALDALRAKQQTLKAAIADIQGAIDAQNEAYRRGTSTVDQKNRAVAQLELQLAALQSRHDNLTPAIDGLKQKIHEAKIAEEARAAGLQQVTTGTKNLADATDEAWDSLSQFQSLLLASSGSQLGYQQSLLNVETAQKAYNDAVREHGPASLEARQASLNLQQAQQGAMVAALSLDDAQTNLNRTTLKTPEAIDAEIRKLEESKKKHPEVAAAIDVQIWSLGVLKSQIESVPTHHKTTFEVEMEEAYRRLEEYRLEFERVARETGVDWRERVFAGIYGYQHGGPVPGGKTQPVPIMAHGGEYVLSADVVERIKAGRPSVGAGLGTAAAGTGGPSSLTIPLVLDGRVITQVVVSNLNRAGGPKITQHAVV